MKFKILTAVVVVCLATILVASVSTARKAACEMSCRNTFKSIGLALLTYNDFYRTLPPAVTLSASGQPKHSWRPLILNYVVAMPPIYDIEDSWDGPNNVRLINGHEFHFEKPPEHTKGIGPYHGPLDFAQWFHCCAHKSKIDYSANVVAVVGRETLWDDNIARELTNIPDGPSNTILLAETRDLHIYWSEPKDLVFDDMSFEINSAIGTSISSNHPNGPAIVMADCSTYRLSPKTPAEIVRALLTCNGGEPYTSNQLLRDGFLIPDR